MLLVLCGFSFAFVGCVVWAIRTGGDRRVTLVTSVTLSLVLATALGLSTMAPSDGLAPGDGYVATTLFLLVALGLILGVPIVSAAVAVRIMNRYVQVWIGLYLIGLVAFAVTLLGAVRLVWHLFPLTI